jgi:hypothetical protein
LQVSSSTDATVAEYLSSLSGPARRLFDDDSWNDKSYEKNWDRSDQTSEKNWDRSDQTSEKNWNETSNDIKVKYSTLPSKKFSSSSSSTSSSRCKSRQKSRQPQISTVRLSSFGAEKVCPVVAKDEEPVTELNPTDFSVSQSFCFNFNFLKL